MLQVVDSRGTGEGFTSRINGRWHRRSLAVFGVIVLAHWAEHLVQAAQIWVFDMHRGHARGAAGHAVPWLATSEWLHYGYALVMLVGFALLRPGFRGRSGTVWAIALVIQIWHHLEHALLLYQAQIGSPAFGRSVPTSVLQLLWPRVELHLFYNAAVTIPMLAAMWFHAHPEPAEAAGMTCSCASGALVPAAA